MFLFRDSPVVKTPLSTAGGVNSTPGQGAKILQAEWYSKKKKKKYIYIYVCVCVYFKKGFPGGPVLRLHLLMQRMQVQSLVRGLIPHMPGGQKTKT